MPENKEIIAEPSTEEKIKAAARKIFHQKGFSGTRTRDIAEAADINLALLNYYFRSKEKLFHLIMMEDVRTFLKSISASLDNLETTFDEKIDLVVANYIDILKEQPHIPLFVLSELRTDPNRFISSVGIKDTVLNSVFLKQFMVMAMSGKMQPINPIHFAINLISMTVFPFVSAPMLKEVSGIDNSEFLKLMDERKQLIPKWVKAMIYV